MRIFVMVAAIAGLSQLSAQRGPRDLYRVERTAVLNRNTGLLRMAVAMDRTEYFPGESAQISVSIVNPTTGPLEVYEPFHPGTGFIEIRIKKGDGPNVDWLPISADEGAGRGDNQPTRFIAAGQTLERTFNSHEGEFDGPPPLFNIP